MIRIIQYDSSEVTSRDDRAFYEQIVAQSGIFYGCGITHLGANQISISDGRGIASGANFSIEDETVNVELSTSGQAKGRLYIRIDLNNAQTPIEILSIVANTLPELTQEDLGKDGQVYEMALAEYDVSTSAISNIIDKRNMLAPVSEQKYTDIALYVSTTGSDDTGDGTSANPFATVTNAVAQIPVYAGHTTIEVAAGTYDEAIYIEGKRDIEIRANVRDGAIFKSIQIVTTTNFDVNNLKFTGSTTIGTDIVTINTSRSTGAFGECTIQGAGSGTGAAIQMQSTVILWGCTFNGYDYAIFTSSDSNVLARYLNGSSNGICYWSNQSEIRYMNNSMTGTTIKGTSNGGEVISA